MEKNYKMTLAYDGTRYQGWESHKAGDMTIQGKLVNVIEHLSGGSVEVIGCGRTDAGVHAKGMVANVRLDVDMTPEEVQAYLNHYLPEDIAILDVCVASERFHSRYHAVGKTYCYTCYVGSTKPVFDRKYVYVLDQKPDVTKMRKAAELLTGTHDFASFCANKKKKKSTVRTVDKIEITVDGAYLKFTVHGDGFLHHMVRILVGTLLEVGWGKRSTESITELLAACERAKAGVTAPAQGLCMVSVDY
ncbi:MAG: tRNA pseudouridine(38-40) synthase TruA [Roseburia sp.]|nr:tRNA pseudouridine(38-40) synthase TruA [Roseburia sp.]